MKTLILIGLLVSGPLHARYSAIDEGACAQKVATTRLNIEEASCVGKDCSCYTKVFREQIDGLALKRKEQVSVGLEKTYIDAATSQMRDLLDIDLLSSIKKGTLSGGRLPSACSFDSLKTILSCKNSKAKKIVKSIHENFMEMSEYFVEDSQKKAIKNKTQCLTPLEKRGVALISEVSRKEKRFERTLMKLSQDKFKPLLDKENPLEFLRKSNDRDFKRLYKELSGLPVISSLFTSQSGLQAFLNVYSNKGSEGLVSSLYSDPSTMGHIKDSASRKCKMIFESIDTLACQNTSDFYVINEKFNNETFSYYSKTSSDQKENSLENHLFYCESKKCLASKCKKEEGYSPEEFLESISMSNTRERESKLTKNTNIEELICPSLVCPMSENGIENFAKDQVVNNCDPLAKEKKDPLALYKSLGCPKGDNCETPFARNLKIYADFYQASYSQTEGLVDTGSDELVDENGEITLTARKVKKSEFVENFVGVVGKDIDGFFANEVDSVEDLADKEEKKEKTQQISQVDKREKTKKISRSKKMAFPNSNKFRASNFEATEIPVERIPNPESTVDAGIVQDAIDAARESINEAKKWQQAFQKNKKDQNTTSRPFNDNNSKESKNAPNRRSGNTINNYYSNAPEKEQVKIPVTVEIGNQEEYGSLDGEGRGVTEGVSRKPAGLGKSQSLVIEREKLAELNKSLLNEFSIDPLKPFVLKIWIKIGNDKKLVEVPVENTFYKGKMILKPVKDSDNSEIYKEVLNSPIFFDYRNLLVEREERREFFKEVLPNVKKL